MSALTAGFVVLILYAAVRAELRQQLREHAAHLVALAALQQNGDEFEKIQSAQDPLYETFRLQNLKIRRADPEIAYVFTAAKDRDGLYFVVDAGEPGEPNIARYGERYEEPSPALLQNYDTMTGVVVDEEIYEDDYGAFISAYAPIFTSDGRRVGVVGLDFTADTVKVKERAFLWFSIAVFVSALPFVALAGWTLGVRLSQPIGTLARAASQFAAGQELAPASLHSRAVEIQELAQGFNAMTAALRDLINDLEKRVEERSASLEAARLDAELARQQAEAEAWYARGQALLADEMRGDLEVGEIADRVVSFLCRYLGAQTGAFYLLEDGVLKLTGRCAYAEHPNRPNEFRMSETLTGEAARANQILKAHVAFPDSLLISSALGNAQPSETLIAPIAVGEEVCGAVELATLSRFTGEHEALLRRVSESVAVACRAAQSRLSMNRLLERLQTQADELQAQEEELRAANEELQAQAEALRAAQRRTK